MKVIYDDHLFDTIPGLCVGILAVRALRKPSGAAAARKPTCSSK